MGPVKAPERCYTTLEPNSAAANDKRSNSNVGEDIDGEEVITSKKRKHDSGRKEENRSSRPENKKSRRRNEDDDKALEETYMRKIEEQAKKDLERQEQESKKLKLVAVDTPEGEDSQDEDRSADVENRATDGHEPDSESDSGSEDGDEDSAKPIRHETQDSAKSEELEKSARTIFLGNVPTSAITSKVYSIPRAVYMCRY